MARRPSAFTFAAMSLAAVFLAGGAWLLATPRPLAGEPVVVAAIPPAAELLTASTGLADDGEPPGEEADVEEVIEQSVPIRLTHTPTICWVLPITRVELVEGG
jgi:hypothetical protein